VSKILIVDDDKEYLESLKRVLHGDFEIFTASSMGEVRELNLNRFDLVMLDIRLNHEDMQNTEGIDLLKGIKVERPYLPVMMMTAYGDVDIAVETMKLGASDFVQKGRVDIREFTKIITKTLERAGLEKKVEFLERELNKYEPREIIGEDPEINRIRNMIDIVAEDAHVSVLIRGETGTGKELVARAIHSCGRRKEQPFIPVSLSSLNKQTIGSDLFGHEKGAFTDAKEKRIGLIEEADRGILFLDEIGDLDSDIQSKLLRVLEEREFTRLGGNKPLRVDIQLIAATNKDLEKAVTDGTFRKDLYFRLKGVEIPLPPLAMHKDDILSLASHFLSLLRKQGRTDIGEIADEAMAALKSYSWPGNVRELKQALERAALFADHDNHKKIIPSDLPYEIHTGKTEAIERYDAQIPEFGVNLGEKLAKLELAYIREALKKCGGKKTNAWKLLGYNDRFALRRRMDSIKKKYPHLT
jgi:DNA-binding NtrC family response regulator